jgi:hypothetical protein
LEHPVLTEGAELIGRSLMATFQVTMAVHLALLALLALLVDHDINGFESFTKNNGRPPVSADRIDDQGGLLFWGTLGKGHIVSCLQFTGNRLMPQHGAAADSQGRGNYEKSYWPEIMHI